MQTTTILLITLFSAGTLNPQQDVIAQDSMMATSESRDAATGFIGTRQFFVGRIGRDCLSRIGRTQTPKQFVDAWIQRNSRYVISAQKYLAKRAGEAEAKGEEATKDLLEELAKLRVENEARITSAFGPLDNEKSCQKAVDYIESKQFDITPDVPMFEELESLVRWAANEA
jgi:hypothetical protein